MMEKIRFKIENRRFTLSEAEGLKIEEEIMNNDFVILHSV